MAHHLILALATDFHQRDQFVAKLGLRSHDLKIRDKVELEEFVTLLLSRF